VFVFRYKLSHGYSRIPARAHDFISVSFRCGLVVFDIAVTHVHDHDTHGTPPLMTVKVETQTCEYINGNPRQKFTLIFWKVWVNAIGHALSLVSVSLLIKLDLDERIKMQYKWCVA
jgi:hypothetical protein